MSRNMSANAVISAFSQETAEIYLAILELDHAELSSPIYVVNNTEDIISNSQTYIGFPFKIELPEDTGDELVRVTLTIDNVSRTIVQAVRSCTSSPSVTLSILLASSPDTIEAGPYVFSLVDASWNTLVVSGELSYEDILNEPYPGNTFSPAEYPSLF